MVLFPLGNIADAPEKRYLFRNLFLSDGGVRIIAEDVIHDLGGRERVRYYLNAHEQKDAVLFLLPVPSREDAAVFLEQSKHKNRPVFAFAHLDVSAPCALNPEPQKEDLPPCDYNDSAYRFMEGTPLSFFHSSVTVPRPEPEKEALRPEGKPIPEGSEIIDDML